MRRFRIGGAARGCALPAVALLALAAMPCAAKEPGKPKSPSAASQQDLVWPLPPDPPRVRWLGQIQSLDEVKGKVRKKASWIDRMAGSSPPEERKLGFKRPYGIAVDSRGRIYVADSGQRVVFVLDQAQKQFEVRRGLPRAPLGLPVGVALDEKDRLYVSDAYLHSILCFNPAGEVVAQFGTDKVGRPAGLAIDRQRRRLYVADAKAHRLAVFNIDTFAFLRYIGEKSTPEAPEPGRFLAPTNLAVDRHGNVYVADTWNNRIQVLDSNGRFLRAFGRLGVRPGDFVRPKGIAVDSEGHIYVADAEFNNFQILSPEGRPLLAVGSLGDAPGQFVLIAGIYIDSEDRIFTSEQQGRIQIFKYLAPPAAGGGKEVTQANSSPP